MDAQEMTAVSRDLHKAKDVATLFVNMARNLSLIPQNWQSNEKFKKNCLKELKSKELFLLPVFVVKELDISPTIFSSLLVVAFLSTDKFTHKNASDSQSIMEE